MTVDERLTDEELGEVDRFIAEGVMRAGVPVRVRLAIPLLIAEVRAARASRASPPPAASPRRLDRAEVERLLRAALSAEGHALEDPSGRTMAKAEAARAVLLDAIFGKENR